MLLSVCVHMELLGIMGPRVSMSSSRHTTPGLENRSAVLKSIILIIGDTCKQSNLF